MYVLCRTLEVQPSAFLVSSSETERLLGEFRQKFLAGEARYIGKGSQLKSGKDTSIRQYVMAVRSFCLRNDRPLPHNIGGVYVRQEGELRGVRRRAAVRLRGAAGPRLHEGPFPGHDWRRSPR